MDNLSVEDVFSFLEDSDLHEVAVIFKGECFHFNLFSTRYLFYNVLKYVHAFKVIILKQIIGCI